MELIIDCVLRSVLITRKDLFGDECTFLKFEADDGNFDWAALQSSGRFGRIAFRNTKDERVQYSDHLALKFTAPRQFAGQFSSLQFSNEVFFFTRILPFFDNYRNISYLFPQYYDSLLQYSVQKDKAAIVFENVQAAGYISSSKKSYLSYDHLALMLRKIGEFHAYSYHTKQKDPDRFHALLSTTFETNAVVMKQFFAKHLLIRTTTRGLESLKNDPERNSYHDKLRKAFEEYDEIMIHMLTGERQNETHVLCHGDFVANNVLFRYENGKPVDLKLVDMATWRLASPVLDVALVLYLHADQQMRRDNWDKLIDEYYTAVRDTFPSSKVPSKTSILAEFKDRALYAYLVASYFLPPLAMDDSGVGQTFAEYRENALKKESFDFLQALMTLGGEEATVGLSNILKDIIDREFI